MPKMRLSKLARRILNLAAREGDDQGFIDSYRCRAGNTEVSQSDELDEVHEFEAAVEELLRHNLGRRLKPAHMEDRKGMQLNERGYRLAAQLNGSPD